MCSYSKSRVQHYLYLNMYLPENSEGDLYIQL